MRNLQHRWWGRHRATYKTFLVPTTSGLSRRPKIFTSSQRWPGWSKSSDSTRQIKRIALIVRSSMGFKRWVHCTQTPQLKWMALRVRRALHWALSHTSSSRTLSWGRASRLKSSLKCARSIQKLPEMLLSKLELQTSLSQTSQRWRILPHRETSVRPISE